MADLSSYRTIKVDREAQAEPMQHGAGGGDAGTGMH